MSHDSKTCEVLVHHVADGSLPEEELRHILTRRIGNAQLVVEEPDRVQYLGPEGEGLYLTLTYLKGELASVEPGQDLPGGALDEILADVEAELGPPSWVVRRRVAFYGAPWEGAWRYGDRFQLVPPPPKAPRPLFLDAQHPVVLEIRVRQSVDPILTEQRTEREVTRVALLLGLIFRQRFELQPRYIQNHWVYVVEQVEPNLKFRSDFLQEGYKIEGWTPMADSFSEDLPVCTLVDATQYYTSPGISLGDPLTLPESASRYLDLFLMKDRFEQDRFLRACYWWDRAQAVWLLSRSMSWTALVQAVEVLIVDPKGSPVCTECNRKVGPGPTRLFRELVDRFSPGSDKKIREGFYHTRSQIDHGHSILLSDEVGMLHPGLHPSSIDEQHIQKALQGVVRAVLLNFLMGDDKAGYIGTPPPLKSYFMSSAWIGEPPSKEESS